MSPPDTQAAPPAVGFIGLGDQGGPMATAIAEGGFPLHVWARRPQSLAGLGPVAYIVHDTPAALGERCDIVAMCLNDDKDLLDVLDNRGLLAALKPGSIVVNHGTGEPEANRQIAARLQAQGIGFLDAPVSGGRPGAVSRILTTIVGGDAAVLARCTPVFSTFSRKVAHMGPSGSGQLTKLLNNALTMTNLDNLVSVAGLVDKLGMNFAPFVDMLAHSSGSSAILEALQGFTPELAMHLQGLMHKDIGHFSDEMISTGLDARELYERGMRGASGLAGVVGMLVESRKLSC